MIMMDTMLKAVSPSKMRNGTKTKNHTFPAKQVLDPIHRHVFGRIEILVELLYLSRARYVGGPHTLLPAKKP
jgi:hypothetical protein